MDKRQPKLQPPGLRLEIQRAGGGFLAVVKTAGKEEVSSHVFEHTPDSLVLNEALWTLDPQRARQLDEQHEATKSAPLLTGDAEGLLKRAGQKLYEYAFGDGVYFRQFLRYNETYRQQARLAVCLHKDAGELWRLPWEYLHDGEAFLGQTGKLLISRVPLGLPELTAPERSRPLRALVVMAGPDLDFERELKVLNLAFDEVQRAGLLQLDLLQDATLSTLQAALSRKTYDVLHYSGHAAYSAAKGVGELYLEDEEGYPVAVSADELRALLVGQKLKLVVLSACQTAKTGGRQAFDSVATALLREAIPAVLAMQFRVDDVSATEISRVFYSQLVLGRSVIEAMHQVRLALHHRDLERLAVERYHDWGVPALYVQSSLLRLFDEGALRAEARAPNRVSVFRGGLPTPHDFVGRPSELRQLRLALRERKRALFIRGLGGIGKSTLAAKLLERSGLPYLTVRCGECSLPGDLLARIAAFWRARETPAHRQAAELLLEPLLDLPTRVSQALGALGDCREVILFDNLESWFREAELLNFEETGEEDVYEIGNSGLRAILLGFLSVAGGPTLVFTSRECWAGFADLSIQDRIEVHLGSLSLHQAVLLMSALPHLRCESLAAKQKAYELVGGHPLTLELLDSWSMEEHGLTALLDSGTAEARLQGWSAKLLDDLLARLPQREQKTLRSLSVLDGAFPLEAVRALAPSKLSELQARTFLRHCQTLSLVEAPARASRGEVASIHSVVRQHLLSGISSKDVCALHSRAADYYGAFFAKRQRDLYRTEAKVRLRRWDPFAALILITMALLPAERMARGADGVLPRLVWPDGDNGSFATALSIALSWQQHLFKAERYAAAAEVVIAVFAPLASLGRREDCRELLAKFSPERVSNFWSRILRANLAILLQKAGHLRNARKILEECLRSPLFRWSRQRRSMALAALASLLKEEGLHDESIKMKKEFFDVRQPLLLDDRCSRLLNAAEFHLEDNNYRDAAALSWQAYELAKRIRHYPLMANSLYVIAQALNGSGDIELSVEMLQKSKEMADQLRLSELSAVSAKLLGDHQRKKGNLLEAFKYYSQSLEIHARLGDRNRVFDLQNLGSVYELEGDIKSALAKYEQARSVAMGGEIEGTLILEAADYLDKKIATLKLASMSSAERTEAPAPEPVAKQQ